MSDYHRAIGQRILPVNPIAWGTLPGRSGDLLLQAA
jgi:undecaprenyl phosphate-alpha-L-ara4FN deformylase